jgi:hypothetical protein
MKLCLIFTTAFLVVCGAACSSPTAPTPPITAHGVTLSVEVPGRCLLACDPVSNEVTTPGLVTLRNTAPTVAYVRRCGPTPAISEQEFVGGQWVNVGPAISCINAPGPISIAAGDSLQLNWFFASGRRRLVLGVASQATMSDEALVASASVDVK